MVFITIMTRGAAGFFRFFRKNQSGRPSCQRFFDSSRHKENPCGNPGGSARSSKARVGIQSNHLRDWQITWECTIQSTAW